MFWKSLNTSRFTYSQASSLIPKFDRVRTGNGSDNTRTGVKVKFLIGLFTSSVIVHPKSSTFGVVHGPRPFPLQNANAPFHSTF